MASSMSIAGGRHSVVESFRPLQVFEAVYNRAVLHADRILPPPDGTI